MTLLEEREALVTLIRETEQEIESIELESAVLLELILKKRLRNLTDVRPNTSRVGKKRKAAEPTSTPKPKKVKETKEAKEAKEAKEVKEVKEAKETKQTKEVKDNKDTKESPGQDPKGAPASVPKKTPARRKPSASPAPTTSQLQPPQEVQSQVSAADKATQEVDQH